MMPGTLGGMEHAGLHLLRSDDRAAEVDAFADRVGSASGCAVCSATSTAGHAR